MADTHSHKSRLKQRLAQMERKRQDFEPYWRDLVDGLDPRKRDFIDKSIYSGPSDGPGSVSRRYDKEIINNRIKQARRVAVSGMYAGTISPSKPWFKIETEDKSLMAASENRQWIFDLEERLRKKLLINGFYQAAIPFIEELLDFSTAVMTDTTGPDGNPLFEYHVLGSYYISHNRRQEVDVLALRKTKTARQLYEAYVEGGANGEDVLSPAVRQALKENNHERSFTIVQVIEPNKNYVKDAVESKFKKYRATTFDPEDSRDVVLEDKGFDTFPAYAVRWSIVGNEPYGTGGPGMVALGDTRQLQHQEKKKARAIEVMVDPLLKGPPDLKNVKIPSNRSNGLIVYDDMRNKLEPVYQIDPRIGELTQDMLAIENRINEAYFVNLFQAISSMQGVQPRNREELLLRNEESLLVLGPLLERFQREFLQKVLERNLERVLKDRDLDGPPEALSGKDVKFNFVSTLVQAQRSTESAINQRFLRYAGELATIKPEVLDKIDGDAAVEVEALLSGVNPRLVLDQEATDELRQQRAETQRQIQEQQAQQQQASANSQNAAAIRQVVEAANATATPEGAQAQ